MKRIYVTLLIFLVIVISGCNQETAEDKMIQVAAASDLYHALTEIGEQFTKETGIEVVFSFGSTGLLAKQIEEGAPFDLFAAAHESYIDELINKQAILADSKKNYAVGRLGFMTASEPSAINEEYLLSDDVKTIAIANPEHAPYGKAAKEVLESLGLWETLTPKIVYAENIRQAYQYVESGNADVGLIAVSLMVDSGVDYSLIDQSTYQPILQGLGIPAHTKKEEMATEFADFILSEEGQIILTKFGFDLPEGDF